MAWGTMFDNRFDYALGIFNGTRNGYVDSNDFKDFAGLREFPAICDLDGSPA